jgi:hypothetical protein
MGGFSRPLVLAVVTATAVFVAPAGWSAPEPAAQGGRKAMFATKAEAEAAAKHFNCKGAHRMGEMWMPCASHGEASGKASSPMAH